MSLQKIAIEPEIFITEKAINYIRQFLNSGPSEKEGEKYIPILEWCEKSRHLSSEFTADLLKLKNTIPEKEFAIELKKTADAHAEWMPPHVGLGAIEPWQCSDKKIHVISNLRICVDAESFETALKFGNIIHLSQDGKLILVEKE